jgi:hypothetical protein
MKVDPWKSKDLWAGLVFILIGGLAMIIARSYPMGSAMRMGPGYFPTILGGLLSLFGIYLFVHALVDSTPGRSTPSVPENAVRGPPPHEEPWAWKPLALITLAMVLFGFTVSRLGLIPALVVMFFVSALAGREFRFKEMLVLTVSMSTFAVCVFVYGLKLPFRLLVGL